jgi:hypothetical protein
VERVIGLAVESVIGLGRNTQPKPGLNAATPLRSASTGSSPTMMIASNSTAYTRTLR